MLLLNRKALVLGEMEAARKSIEPWSRSLL